jgi:ATP-dependent DNA ligase
MKLPTLYSRTSTGKVQHWTIEALDGRIRTIYGPVGGKVTTTAWYDSKPSNEGRANARTAVQQAEFEAKALWKKKIEVRSCFEDISKIDTKTVGLDVMLAYTLDDFLDPKQKRFVDVTKGVGVQNKYNGVRCSAQLEDGEVVLRSRGFKVWVTVPHINASLKTFFAKYPNAKLDGELYNYDLRQKLNELISIVRQKWPNAEQLAQSEAMVRYYVYDGFDFTDKLDQDSPYCDRKEFIDLVLPKFSKYYREVKTTMVYSMVELEKLYESFLAAGDEGAIIRLIEDGYENGRSRSLFKYKPEDDAEGVIRAIIEGEGNGAGAAVKFTITWNDKTFDGMFKGSYAIRKAILENQVDWIGETKTFLYTGLTGLGTPNYARIDPSNCERAD